MSADTFYKFFKWQTFIDENLPDLCTIPFFLFAIIFFSGYGHRHISGSLNLIKKVFSWFLLSGHSHLWTLL